MNTIKIKITLILFILAFRLFKENEIFSNIFNRSNPLVLIYKRGRIKLGPIFLSQIFQ